MKKLAVFFLGLLLMASCDIEKDNDYSKNEISYDLYPGSDFEYSGKVNVRELLNGDLEFRIVLEGNKSDTEYFFPAHLHFGAYNSTDAPIAYLLNPVDIRSLESITVLGQLSNGTKLDFDAFKNFDGHIKIHLADSGPEYQVILTAGNIGGNDNSQAAFKKEEMTLCSPYY